MKQLLLTVICVLVAACGASAPLVAAPTPTPSTVSPATQDSGAAQTGLLRVGQHREAIYIEGFISFLQVTNGGGDVVVDRIYRFADNEGLLTAEPLPPGDYKVRSWMETPMDGTTPTGRATDECTTTTAVLAGQTTNLQVRGQEDGECSINPQDHTIAGTKPEAYVLREPLESCGFAISAEGRTPDELPRVPMGFDCLLEAQDNGRSAELLQITSAEGEKVSRVWRVLSDATVEVFVERTTTGGAGVEWTRLTCTDIALQDAPADPTAEGCGPAETLPLPERTVVEGAGLLVALDPATGERSQQISINGDQIGAPTIDDGVAYVAGTTGDAPPAVLAVDLDSGQELWRWSAGQLDRWASPVLAKDVVIAGTLDGRVIAIDRDDGTQRWSVDVGESFGGPPLAVAGNAVVAGAELPGSVTVLDTTTGEERWRVDDLGVGTQTTVSEDLVVATIYDDNEAGRVIAWDPADGQQRWSVDIPRGLLSPPVVVGDLVVVSGARTSGDAAMTGLDVDSGEQRWEAPLPGTFAGSLRANSQAVVAANDGGLFAVSSMDGMQLWTAKPGLIDGLTLVHDLVMVQVGDDLVAYSTADGTQRWIDSPGAIPAEQMADGIIWVAESQG